MTSNDQNPESVLDADAAARILGVESDQIDAMVEQGLLNPLAGHQERRFDASEVRAVRTQGG
jgi:hypothetical protein